MDPIEEIKGLYFKASKQTIARDFARAIDLLKTLPDEESRERVAVYMDGLAQMRAEWQAAQRGPGKPTGARPARGRKPGGGKPRAEKSKT
jgi:hypothetical protein